MAAEPADVSEDAVLDGRLVLRQPRRGHRVGHDAILLAAASSARPGDRLIELGAGVGAAGLAVARRVERLAVTLVDIDPVLTALARENAVRNGLAERVRAVCIDVTAAPEALAAAGLGPGAADHALMNPPFNPPQNPSPDRRRSIAHVAAADALDLWVGAAARLLGQGGVLTLLWRADGLAAVLAALAADFGAIAVLPVHSRPDQPAIRILVRAVKMARAPLSLLPGFLLNDQAGMSTAAADAVLRGRAVLPLAGDASTA